MTERRDLKRRVRARQARTGESYMTALRHVQAERPTAIPTVELVDLTELGAPVGLKCRLAMFPGLAGRIDVPSMLVRLRDALLATEDDRALALMRAVVLRGERARAAVTGASIEDARRFIARARAGIGGVSESGRMLALPFRGRPARRGAAREPEGGGGAGGPELLLFLLQITPTAWPVPRDPMLVITSLDGLSADPLLGWAEEAVRQR